MICILKHARPQRTDRMQKYKVLLASIFMLPLLMTGCGKDETDHVDGRSAVPPAESSARQAHEDYGRVSDWTKEESDQWMRSLLGFGIPADAQFVVGGQDRDGQTEGVELILAPGQAEEIIRRIGDDEAWCDWILNTTLITPEMTGTEFWGPNTLYSDRKLRDPPKLYEGDRVTLRNESIMIDPDSGRFTFGSRYRTDT